MLCLVSGKERGTHSVLSAQSVQMILPPPIFRSVPQELKGVAEIARLWCMFGTQSTGGRASGFPSSSSFVFRRGGMDQSYSCLPIPSVPQSSDLGGWVVHLSFVRSFLTLVVLLACPKQAWWLSGEWNSGGDKQTSISIPLFSSILFLESSGCAEGWQFSVSSPSDHPAVPPTSIPTAFPCPLQPLINGSGG